MILLFGAALLIAQSEALFRNSLQPHLVDNLRLKCEALPYRTVFEGTRCYFAIFQKVPYNDASTQCAAIMNGSKVALNVPVSTLDSMMVDKSLFHTEAGSGEKHTLCLFENGYECEKGQSMLRGKCGIREAKKMNFVEALKSCKKRGMELFSPTNDFDNQVISRDLVKDPAWVQKSLDNRANKFVWNIGQSYARFTTCDGTSRKPKLYAGSQTTCSIAQAAVIEKNGYWSNTDQKNEMDVICTKVATNELTPTVVIKKPVITDEAPCVEQHERDEETGKCEWTGHIDACAMLFDYWNTSYSVKMERFPEVKHTEDCLSTRRDKFNEYAVKVVVRRGCMFTGYAYPRTGDARQEMKVGENLVYGAHQLINYMTSRSGLKQGAYFEDLSRIHCFCDPTEAAVSGHVPAPPDDKKCIEHHVFNETTQQCEWNLEPKLCAQIITNDNRKQFLEIPNWPTNRKYDVNHLATKAGENFHLTVTSIIIRQHCFATLMWDRRDFHPWKTLPTMGYGQYTVASRENGLATPGIGGTARFVCECIR